MATRPRARRKPTPIAAEIKQLLGASWTDEHGTRPLTTSDVLRWRRTTPRWRCCVGFTNDGRAHGVRVGTVDKFQGTQAPVVFISMTALVRR